MNKFDLAETAAPSTEQSGNVGERLRYEREKRGLTQQEIASRLCLSVNVIAALEEDRMDDLPQGVYVRGYQRRYCKELGIEPETLVVVPGGDAEVIDHKDFSDSLSERHHQTIRVWGTVALITVIGILLAMQWLDSRDDLKVEETIDLPAPEDNASSPALKGGGLSPSSESKRGVFQPVEQDSDDAASDETVLDTVVPEEIRPYTEEVEPTGVLLNDGSDDFSGAAEDTRYEDAAEDMRREDAAEDMRRDEDAAENMRREDAAEDMRREDAAEDMRREDAVEDTRYEDAAEDMRREDDVDRNDSSEDALYPGEQSDAAARQNNLAESPVALTMSSADQCWTKITDANGVVLIERTVPSGYLKTVYGASPFNVRLGNAAVVQLRINGELYDISPHINRRLGTAFFEISASEER